MAAGSTWHYVTGLSRETLEEFWEKLLTHADFYEQEEMKYFIHCTSFNRKESILKSGRLEGGFTGLPKKAPLASNPELLGIWLAPSTVDIPQKSPYGTHRISMKTKDLIGYMFQPYVEETDADSGDRWDAESSEEETQTSSSRAGRKGKGGKKGKEQKSKKRKPEKKNQKDCYRTGQKSASQPRAKGEKPSLFFECAHYYGNTQYVRMVLVRAGHPQLDWCYENLMEVNIHDNPFFQLKWGKVFSYTGEHGRKELVVELLVAGDIVLDKLDEKPTWETVGKIQRAGFDPRIGVLG